MFHVKHSGPVSGCPIQEPHSSRRCKSCHAAQNRKYRAQGKGLNKTSLKRFARETLNLAVHHGLLEKNPCEVCGETKVEAHHNDYSKPLEVQWLCKRHHVLLHLHQRHGNKVVSLDSVLYKPDEVAEILELHICTVHNHLRDGTLRGVKLHDGPKAPWRVTRESIFEFIGKAS